VKFRNPPPFAKAFLSLAKGRFTKRAARGRLFLKHAYNTRCKRCKRVLVSAPSLFATKIPKISHFIGILGFLCVPEYYLYSCMMMIEIQIKLWAFWFAPFYLYFYQSLLVI
jgi:hypothetical protein